MHISLCLKMNFQYIINDKEKRNEKKKKQVIANEDQCYINFYVSVYNSLLDFRFFVFRFCCEIKS